MNTADVDPTIQYAVYTGYWTNWSQSPVFRATLTLTRSDANLLIAFIAFFIAFVGTRFWYEPPSLPCYYRPHRSAEVFAND
jgi:hypothetical protein